MNDNVGKAQLETRIKNLEGHLRHENPVLLQVVRSFRLLDKLAYRLGLLDRCDSYAVRVSWWPTISIVGTFSSGKSSFINHYLGESLQATGNQAVDDKFTVICYSDDEVPRVLPGLALDADPRFPFYQTSEDIEAVAAGEGRRVDAYLQLKTCDSKKLLGKILIDSPGFDADAQRTSTLRITDHIIDLSDLVLVFFDARHPEPGAMRDTLQHLVTDTMNRPDSTKFLYVLNQIDATAREDNPEEVFAAWQRALAQRGLTAGRFYSIYNPEAAVYIENDKIRARFEAKRDADIGEIYDRMEQVEVERAYRIIGVLEKTAKRIEHDLIPRLAEAKRTWKRRVLRMDAAIFGTILALLAGIGIWAYLEGQTFDLSWPVSLTGWIVWGVGLAAVLSVAGYIHFKTRKLVARGIAKRLGKDIGHTPTRETLLRAFKKNTGPTHSIFATKPVGWSQRARKRIARVVSDADGYVQTLNDRFTSPSGSGEKSPATAKAPATAITPPPAEPVRENEEGRPKQLASGA